MSKRDNERLKAIRKMICCSCGTDAPSQAAHYNFNVGNAIKYLWRNGLKDVDTQTQDLEKAVWYVQREIQRLKRI